MTKRKKEIIQMLLENTTPLTSKELAQNFSVSVRTIKYDLDDIREWIKQFGTELFSKRGMGIWFELNESQKKVIQKKLFTDEVKECYFTQDERIKHLILSLLNGTDFETIEDISNMLEVSQNTIVKDLETAEKLLLDYDLSLVRQSGQGLKIAGQRIDKRHMIEKIIHDKLSEYDIFLIMKILTKNNIYQDEEKLEQLTLSLDSKFNRIYYDVLIQTANIISQKKIFNIEYNEILSITVRITIVIYDLLNEQSIGSYKILSNQLKQNFKNEISFLMTEKIFLKYNLPIFEEEFNYVFSDVSEKYNKLNIQKMIKDLVKSVGKELSYPFEYDAILFNNLFAHISLRLSKQHIYQSEYNPFTEDIKRDYPEIFDAIKKYYLDIFEENHFIPNDSFISYLVMHFSVSLEKYQQKEKINLMYVCSTGLGVTNLLEQKINKEVQGVGKISFSSILDIDKKIQKNKPDLILSIFPIEVEHVPWLKVNPIPTANDLSVIQNKINELRVTNVAAETFESDTNFSEDKNDQKLNESVILKGYSIYQEMKDKVAEGYLDTFLLHVLLMTHRISCNSQYVTEYLNDNNSIQENKGKVIEIEKIFAKNNLAINKSEVIALLQYFN